MKKFFVIFFCFLCVLLPQVMAFEFDFFGFFSNLNFLDFSSKNDSNLNSTNLSVLENKSDLNLIYNSSFNYNLNKSFFDKNLDVVLIQVNNYSFYEKDIVLFVNQNQDFRNYIDKFDVLCVFLNFSSQESFQLNFDLKNNLLESVSLNKNCSNEIFIEKSLIYDILNDGFDLKNVKSYFEKIQMPFSMYYKAMKVFAFS